MNNRSLMILIGVVASLVCLYDLYLAIFGTGPKIFSWILAIIMAGIAISSFRRLAGTP